LAERHPELQELALSAVGKGKMVSDRFDVAGCERTMMAVVTTGNGGYEKLVYREVPVPEPGPGEALLRVLAAGVNNTEINTRLGWYSSSVAESTASTAKLHEQEAAKKSDGGWNEATPFPFIQGTDCCGRVVEVGPGVDNDIIGARVLVRPCMRPNGYDTMENIWMASDFDGAFAQYVKVPAVEVFSVKCDWTDEELATIPCAYGTAENMLHRAAVMSGEHVLVAIGADNVIERNDDLVQVVGAETVDVVVDNVAGSNFPQMLKVLKRGGRYTSSGAIAGPLVTLDMRDMYLKDITLIGCTAWDAPVFPNLVSYIENGEIRPLLAKIFPLEQIADAQREFMKKEHFGNFVLIPPLAED
jgi:NADPH:quinone reductase-like Zn-dependent oxidoreductase